MLYQSRPTALQVYETAGLKVGQKVLDVLKVGETFRVYHVQAESSVSVPDDSGVIRGNGLYKIVEIKDATPFDNLSAVLADKVLTDGTVIGEHLYRIPLVRITRITPHDGHKILYLNRPKAQEVLTEAASVSHH